MGCLLLCMSIAMNSLDARSPLHQHRAADFSPSDTDSLQVLNRVRCSADVKTDRLILVALIRTISKPYSRMAFI